MTPALHLPHPRCSASFAVPCGRPYLRTVCKASRMLPNLHVLQQPETRIPVLQTCVAWPAAPLLSCRSSANFARTCGSSHRTIPTGNSSQLTIRLFPLDVAHDVPGVNTGRDEFRALLAQLGEHLLPVLVDEGHSAKVHHALAFPASRFGSRPGRFQFRNPRMNESAFHRPLLFGRCLGNRDS